MAVPVGVFVEVEVGARVWVAVGGTSVWVGVGGMRVGVELGDAV